MPITEQPGREWQNGIFSCFSDVRVCIFGFFIPCYVMGKNGAVLGEDCLLVGILSCVGFPFGPVLRWRIRQEKGIQGSMIIDSLFWICLPCCSVIQEARELDSMQGEASGSSSRYEQGNPASQSMGRS